MSHTTVTYKGSTQARLDMRWLSDAAQNAEGNNNIASHEVMVGNEKIAIGELFDISGSFTDDEIVLENSNSKMDYIGHALAAGSTISVKGNCGHYAGAELSGGTLKIEGDVSDFAGCSMSAGLIEVSGNGGHYAGSAYTGAKKGMAGGTMLIHGNSGDFTGDLMRRGTIMVVGNIGDYCGSRMIAGTIANLGTIGKQVGVGMRRGTLLLPHKPKDVISGFHDCGRHSLGYLTLLLHELRRHKSLFQSLHPMRRRVQRYMGDSAVGGQGEMLIWIG